jgi:hypothetical protein
MKIRPAAGELFYADGQTDRHMERWVVALHNTVNAPKIATLKAKSLM